MASPFADAKTIRDIGSYLPVTPYDREEHRQAVEAWSVRTNGELPPQVRTPHLFGNTFFDSYILDLVVTQDSLRLTVEAEDGFEFSRALDDLLGRPRANLLCPVDLVMHAPSYVRLVLHDESGTLFESEEDLVVDPEDRAALQNEWFFPRENGLGWVVDAYNLHVPLQSHLLVECAFATAVDRRLDTLVSHFGPAVSSLWHDARAHFRKPGGARLWWEVDALRDYLATRLTDRGLTAADFPAS